MSTEPWDFLYTDRIANFCFGISGENINFDDDNYKFVNSMTIYTVI